MTDYDEPTIRKMITADDVLERIGISRTTLFRLERDGVFPKGIAITPHRKLWYEDEIVAWQRDSQDPNSALWRVLQEREIAKAKKGKDKKKNEPEKDDNEAEEPA